MEVDMQLFSTVLNLKESVDEVRFMDLVKEWNDTQVFAENRIADFAYHGEDDITCGNENLWMSVRRYNPENIIAIRYEKAQDDGTIWDTDYVMNFNTHKLAIRLERSYHEDSLRTDAKFSAPYFITLLIEKGYLKDDHGLDISDKPHFIDEQNGSLLRDVISRTTVYRLPVIYVSRTYYDEDPVDLVRTARQLKGIAHVFAQSSVFSNNVLRNICDSQNAYYGAVDIFFPNQETETARYLYHAETGEDLNLRNRVIRKVLEYSGAKLLSPLETWYGVNRAILMEKMDEQKQLLQSKENERLDALNEVEDVYSTFGKDLEKLRKQVEELSVIAANREYENEKLREKLSTVQSHPVILSGEEEDFFADEIREMALDALSEKLANLPPDSRRAHVLRDLIEHNGYREIHKQRAADIKTLFKDYKNMSAVMRQELINLGFVISEEGKHYRLCYNGDARYKTTVAKSGSDYREGRNIAALIIRMMF